MQEQFSRTQMLLGEEAMEKLKGSHVAVFGIGGVGGHVVDALVRSGVGTITVVDKDTVSVSNINRQLIANHETVGRIKVDVMEEHILRINPECKVIKRACFYLPDTADEFNFSDYDYVVDAVDTVTAKLSLVERAKEAGVPIISSMGAGNKLNPTQFEVADIYKTSVCPLAKVMRRELKKRGITKLKVVYSKEEAITPQETEAGKAEQENQKKVIPGSIAFVPSVAGLILASEVIKDLCSI